jgi:hypothetical protein
VKGLTAGVVGALVGTLLTLGGQQWFTSDLEYQQISRNGYLSTPLGQQGLSMAYQGKPLKNVSIVEFGIFNRTARQFGDVDLVFSVDDPKEQMTLVSSGIITPNGLPHAETVEELPVKDTRTKKFRLKVIPKQRETEYFHAVFVFEGETAPSMSVVSLSKDVSIRAYPKWKDKTIGWSIVLVVTLLSYVVAFAVSSLIQHFVGPWRHRKDIERFIQHADELRKKGELKFADEQAIADARTIYASFTQPKPNKFWSKLFGVQRFDYWL